MTSFSGVTLVLFCFVFVFMLSLKPPFDMQAPRQPQLFLFIFFEMSLFTSIVLYHFRFLFVWRVGRTFFLPNGVFLPYDHGLDF